MSSRSKKHKRTTTTPPPMPAAESRTRAILKQVVRISGWAIVGIGLVASVLSLMPRFSVTSSSPIDPSKPLSVPIVISNEGLLPVSDISILPGIGGFTLENVTISKAELARFPKGTKVIPAGTEFNAEAIVGLLQLNYPELAPTEKLTITLDQLFTLKGGASISSGNVGVTIISRPYGVPWVVERTYRLVTREGADGKLYWLQVPNQSYEK